jgi:hypothetical protein
VRRTVYLIAGIIFIWLLAVLLYSLLTGLVDGTVRDPSGEQINRERRVSG